MHSHVTLNHRWPKLPHTWISSKLVSSDATDLCVYMKYSSPVTIRAFYILVDRNRAEGERKRRRGETNKRMVGDTEQTAAESRQLQQQH